MADIELEQHAIQNRRMFASAYENTETYSSADNHNQQIHPECCTQRDKLTTICVKQGQICAKP